MGEENYEEISTTNRPSRASKYIPLDPAMDSRASQLETEIRQQNSTLKSMVDGLKHIESSQLPGMANALQSLRTSIERIVVADIPNSIKPVEDDISRVRQKFDKFSSEAQTKIQFLNDKLAETSSSISQVLSRYDDLSSFARGSVSEIETELKRQRETLDSSSQRLSSLESGLSQIDDILKSLRNEISTLSRAFSEKISQFQNESISSFAATASSLSSAIKAETGLRQQTMAQIQKQISDVNRNMTDIITKMVSFLTTTKNQYQTALMSLSKASKDGVISCNTSSSEGFAQISSRLDQFVNDSNSQFSTLENDVSSTIQALKNHVVTAKEGLESALMAVSQSRVLGEQEIINKYDELKSSITQRLKQQAEFMEMAAQSAVQSVMSELEKNVGIIKAQLTEVRGQIERISRLETRISQISASAEQTRNQLVDQINSIGHRYTELMSDVEKLNREFEDKSEEIETRLSFFENPANKPNFATKNELNNVIQRTQMLFEGKIEEIEKQIGQIFAHISELTLKNAPRKKKPIESASNVISQLLSEQKLK